MVYLPQTTLALLREYWLKNRSTDWLLVAPNAEFCRTTALGGQAYLQDDLQFHWYVYCKRPFKTNNSAPQYLGRYTHRVAVSNHRIVALKDGQVTFKMAGLPR